MAAEKGMGLAGVLNVARHQSQAGVQRETVAATHHRVVLGARGGWAEAGPISTALIDAAISEAIQNGLPRGTVAATSTPAYKSMRTAIDNLPLDKQPEARMQAAKAWQKAHDAMPDKVTEARESGGGRNGHTSYYTKDNDVKKRRLRLFPRLRLTWTMR